MSASPIKLDLPFVNSYNVEIESQKTLDKVQIQVGEYTLKPKIHPPQEDFFFGELEEYGLPLPVGIKEKTVIDRLSGMIRVGLKSSISSVGSMLFSLSPK